MIAAFKVFFQTVSDVWFNLIGYSACNLIASVGMILLVPYAPLWHGLLTVAKEALPYNERPEIGTLLHDTRANFVTAWKLGALLIVGTGVIYAAFFFYLTRSSPWALPLVAVTGVIAWVWLGILLYAGPLYLRAPDRPLLAIRNALVATLHYPMFTLTLIVLTGIVLLISTFVFPLWFLITLSFLVVLMTKATNWVLVKEGILSTPGGSEGPGGSLLED